MKNINKPIQLKYLLTSGETVYSTPTTMYTTGSFTCKKFMRKREGSTDSLKRSGLETPKTNQTSFNKNQLQKQRVEKVQDSNNYLKLFQSPLSCKNDKILKTPEADPQAQFQKTPYEKQMLQNLNTPDVKKHLNKTQEKIGQNYGVLNYNKTVDFSKSILIRTKQKSVTLNSQKMQAQLTQRSNQVTDTSFNSQIKVLENQLLILEDENLRLKKHISQISLQKQKQYKKRIQVQKQMLKYKNQLQKLKRQESYVMQLMQKELNEIFMNINNFKCINKNISSQCIWYQKVKIFNKPSQTQQFNKNIQQFFQQNIQPLCTQIHKNLTKSNKLLEQSLISVNKLQIKQRVIQKQQFQANLAKNEIKALNLKYNIEKSRVQRYQTMYERLRKQNKQLKSGKGTPSNSFKISNQNLLGYNLNKRNKKQEEFSLSFSECSDEQNIQKQTRSSFEKRA